MANNRNEKINRWLSGPKDWAEGLDLYIKHGASEGLKQIFLASGETAYNMGKLIDELSKLAAGKVREVRSDAKPPSQPAQDPARQTIYSDEVKQLFQERSMLHSQLLTLISQEKRKEHAFKILEISDQVDDLLNYQTARKVKTPMVDSSQLPEDRAELVRLLNNNRAYISKNKNKPEKAEQVSYRTKQNAKIENEISGMAHRTAEG